MSISHRRSKDSSRRQARRRAWLQAAAGAAVLVGVQQSGLAATIYWTGSQDANWGTVNLGLSNWSTDAAGTINYGQAPQTGDNAIFAASGALNLSNTNDMTGLSLNQVQITTAGVTLNGSNALTLTSTANTSTNTALWVTQSATVNVPLVLPTGGSTYYVAHSGATGGLTLTLNGAISGAGTLRFDRLGASTNNMTFTLTGNNSFTGGVVVNQRTIVNANSANALGGGNVTFASGSNTTLNINTAEQSITNLSLNATGTVAGFAVNQALTVNGNLNINAGGTLPKGGGGALLLRGGAGTGTGTLQITGGALSLSATNQLAGNLNLSGGVLVLGDGTSPSTNGISGATFDSAFSNGTGAGQWRVGGGGFAGRGSSPAVLPNNGSNTAAFNANFTLGSGVNVSGSLFANQPVDIQQDTTLTATRIITIANQGPGLVGPSGSGITQRFSGNISGTGSVIVQNVNNTLASLASPVGELTLAGGNTWTGAPVLNVNGATFIAGPGGIGIGNTTSGNTFAGLVGFETPSALPSGNGGSLAYLAAMSRNGTSVFGYVLHGSPGGQTYDLNSAVGSGYWVVIGSIGGGAQAGGTLASDSGNVTLQDTAVALHSSAVGDTQSLQLLTRDAAALTLGTGGSTVSFVATTGAGGTAPNATTLANATAARTLVKRGIGTAVLGNVAYTQVDLSTASTLFNWQIGRATAGNNGVNSYFDGAVRETGTGSTDSLSGLVVQLRGGVLETSGSFTRARGAGAANVNWGAGGGGFSAFGSALTVDIGGAGETLTWASTASFVGNNEPLIFGSYTADNTVTFNNPVNLNNAQREVRVINNPGSSGDLAVLGAVVSSTTPSSGGLLKTGDGVLGLSAANTYTGGTTVANGTLRLIGGSNRLATGGVVTLGAGTTSGVLDLNAQSQELAGLVTGGSGTANRVVDTTGGGTLSLNVASGTNTFAGILGDTGQTNFGLTKVGSGTLVLTANNIFTGATAVTAGTLQVDGTGALSGTSGITLASGATLTWNSTSALNAVLVTLAGGSTLNGTGSLTGNLTVDGVLSGTSTLAGAVNGSGEIDPGNSPGILTLAQVDPSGGLDFNFEFTATGSPNYGNAGASVNDVLRITDGITPFTSNLGLGNVASVYFNVVSLADGNVFKGGWYTDLGSDFLASVNGATFDYYVFGDGGGTHAYNSVNYYTLAEYNANTGNTWGILRTTVAETANFGGGPVTGRVMQFVVPEPGTLALLSLGSLAVLRRRRQQKKL